MVRIEDAIDEAEYVKVAKIGAEQRFLVVWHGGVTFNVYAQVRWDFKPVDTFTVHDEKGRPVSREEAKEHVAEKVEEIEEGER